MDIEDMVRDKRTKEQMMLDAQKAFEKTFQGRVSKALNNPEGEELMSFLVDQYIMRETWAPGAAKGHAQYRAGMNHLILNMKQAIENSKKGGDEE